eukprot:gene3802-2688_t
MFFGGVEEARTPPQGKWRRSKGAKQQPPGVLSPFRHRASSGTPLEAAGAYFFFLGHRPSTEKPPPQQTLTPTKRVPGSPPPKAAAGSLFPTVSLTNPHPNPMNRSVTLEPLEELLQEERMDRRGFFQSFLAWAGWKPAHRPGADDACDGVGPTVLFLKRGLGCCRHGFFVNLGYVLGLWQVMGHGLLFLRWRAGLSHQGFFVLWVCRGGAWASTSSLPSGGVLGVPFRAGDGLAVEAARRASCRLRCLARVSRRSWRMGSSGVRLLGDRSAGGGSVLAGGRQMEHRDDPVLQPRIKLEWATDLLSEESEARRILGLEEESLWQKAGFLGGTGSMRRAPLDDIQHQRRLSLSKLRIRRHSRREAAATQMATRPPGQNQPETRPRAQKKHALPSLEQVLPYSHREDIQAAVTNRGPPKPNGALCGKIFGPRWDSNLRPPLAFPDPTGFGWAGHPWPRARAPLNGEFMARAGFEPRTPARRPGTLRLRHARASHHKIRGGAPVDCPFPCEM